MHSWSQRAADVTAWEPVLLSVVFKKWNSPLGISHGHNTLMGGSLPCTAMSTEVGSH